jgi:hypothetical protein
MPILSYLCHYGHQFEIFHRSQAAAEPFLKTAPCPHCGEQSQREQSAIATPQCLAGGCGGFYKPTS